MIRRTLPAALALMAASGVAWADDVEFLTVGDEAPALKISHWLKGQPVTEFENDKVYVVEFWATWCGPCKASVPHISDLQARLKDYDVTFIGVSDEKLPTVVKFLCDEYEGKLWNEKMAYTVATDPDMSTKLDYMLSAGQTGIPTAFIVGKDQRIEWIGHPQAIDDPLEAVVRDNWDRREFRTEWEEKMAPRREEMKDYLIMQRARIAKDWNTVLKQMDRMLAEKNNPRVLFDKFLLLAKDMKQYDQAWDVAGEFMRENWESAQALNQIAWIMATDEGFDKRNFELAMKAAKRANELTKDENGAILDTVARIYYEMGDLDKALVYQRKAVQFADDQMRAELEANLKRFEDEAGK